MGKVLCQLFGWGLMAFALWFDVALWRSDKSPHVSWSDLLDSEEYQTTRAVVLVAGWMSLYAMKGE